MLHDPTLQQKLLTALLKFPQEWLSVRSFFSEDDVLDGDYKDSLVLSIIRQAIEKGEDVDANIIAQRIERMSLRTETDMSLPEYVLALGKRNCAQGLTLKLAKELKKLSLRRELAATGEAIKAKMESLDQSASYTEILEASDEIYNRKVNHFELDGDVPVDLYSQMEFIVEDRGNNPITEFGMMGPFPTLNKIYGSLVRPGNIGVVCARAKTGKTSWALDYCTHLADNYDCVILHLDNGEMSQEELIFRQCAALSGVKLHYIETGKWRKNAEMVERIRAVWPRVKKLKDKFFYYCVAGMSPDEMCSLAEKFYYSVVGRGKEMTISFDYLKTTGLLEKGMNEWQIVGEMVDGFKKLIAKKILFEGKPKVGVLTYVQANRTGITKNKKADAVVDDESVVALSDRISHFCSHLMYLRKKTPDELMNEGPQFGTHKLICFVARHLGEDVAGHLEPVKVGDELKDNYINLSFENFKISDCGDLRDIVRSRGVNTRLQTQNDDEQPDF